MAPESNASGRDEISALTDKLAENLQAGFEVLEERWATDRVNAVALASRVVGRAYKSGFLSPRARTLCQHLDETITQWAKSKPLLGPLLRALPELDSSSRSIALEWVDRRLAEEKLSTSSLFSAFLRLYRHWRTWPPESLRDPHETGTYFGQAGRLLAAIWKLGPDPRLFGRILAFLQREGQTLNFVDARTFSGAEFFRFTTGQQDEPSPTSYSISALLIDLLFLIDRERAAEAVTAYVQRPRVRLSREQAILSLGRWFTFESAKVLRPYLRIPVDNVDLAFRITRADPDFFEAKRKCRHYLLSRSPWFPAVIRDTTNIENFRVVLESDRHDDRLWLEQGLAESFEVPKWLTDTSEGGYIAINLQCWRAARESLARLGDPEFVNYIVLRLSKYLHLAERYWQKQVPGGAWFRGTSYSAGDELFHDTAELLEATECRHGKIADLVIRRVPTCPEPILSRLLTLADKLKIHRMSEGLKHRLHQAIHRRLNRIVRRRKTRRESAESLRSEDMREYCWLLVGGISFGDSHIDRYLVPFIQDVCQTDDIGFLSFFLENALTEEHRDFNEFKAEHLQELHEALKGLTRSQVGCIRESAANILKSTYPEIPNYEVDAFLSGAGATKVVWRGKQKPNNSTVVIKEYRTSEMDRLFYLYGVRSQELLLGDLTVSRHQHLVPSRPVRGKDREWYLVEEYLDNGMLNEVLKDDARRRKLSRKVDVLRLFVGVCKGMKELHTNIQLRLAHTDLHLGNIGFDQEWRPVICDFGLCKRLENPGACFYPGSMRIRAPELFGPAVKPTEQSDIWSIGCVFFATLTGGDYPYVDKAERLTLLTPYERHQRAMQILSKMRLPDGQKRLDQKIAAAVKKHPELRDVVAKCLKIDRSQRYRDVEQVLKDLSAIQHANLASIPI